MNAIRIFLVVCNLILAIISTAGMNQKFKNESYISNGEIAGCIVVTLVYVINIFFIWK